MPSTTYYAQPGDCLSSIAADHGFKDWTALYNHPDNADLKNKRKDPNILAPGDAVVIPDIKTRSESRATGSSYKFKLAREKVLLKLVLKDADDKPYKQKKYILTIDGKDTKGTTDNTGLLKQKISPTATGGLVKIFLTGGPDDNGVTFPLSFGHLDPVEETSGVHSRLQNLGYDFNPDDPDSFSSAIQGFQKKYGLDQNGNLDDATRNKLKSAHDNGS